MITPQISPLELFQQKLNETDPTTLDSLKKNEIQIVDFEAYHNNVSYAHGAVGILKITDETQNAAPGTTNLNQAALPDKVNMLITHVALESPGQVLTAGITDYGQVFAPFVYDSALAGKIPAAVLNGEFKLTIDGKVIIKGRAARFFDFGRERQSADIDANRGMIVPKFIRSGEKIEATITLAKNASVVLAGGATYTLPLGLRLLGIATMPK